MNALSSPCGLLFCGGAKGSSGSSEEPKRSFSVALTGHRKLSRIVCQGLTDSPCDHKDGDRLTIPETTKKEVDGSNVCFLSVLGYW